LPGKGIDMHRNIWSLFWPVVVAVIALLVIFGGAIVGLYTDWLWFKDLGYEVIFRTIFLTRIKIGLLFGFLFFLVIYGNLWYARRIAPLPSPMSMEQQLLERLGRLARRGIGLVLFAGSVILAAMVGLEAATHWEEWLKYFNAVSFEKSDPVFHKDISFYVFKLPLLNYVYHWLFFTLAAATIASAALHYADEAIEVFGNRLQFAPKVKSHLAILIASMFFLKAWGYRLSMYDLLFARSELFDGAGYTELHANLPALWILILAAIFGGLLVLWNIRRRGIGYALAGLVLVIATSVLIGSIYPAMVQSFSVKPNELEKQKPYIRRSIIATQEAYGLNTVAARRFDAQPLLTAEQISSNSATIENIRLWDQLHLQQAYNQIQTIQQYYHFADIDVDRYWLTDPSSGERHYRQVWLSARELDTSRLPVGSQTWINKHLQYTHGYGFAMSPVNEVNREGLPKFFVKDIPPVASVDIPIKQMGIYFGELTQDYVFVKTSAPEFDYPTGEKQKQTEYKGDTGIKVGGLFHKLLLSFRFSDINILLNENIKPDSKLLFRRNIDERLNTLFNFLQFDGDPYLVTVDGNLYWMRDAYTTTDAYPYSRITQPWDRKVNYIRNSVKVVVNAYNGKVDAYVIEQPLSDPLIRAYQRIFPGTFKPISRMPDKLREHIRYPEDLFRIQTSIYARYHYSKDNPEAFYRNDDLWQIPNRATLTGAADGELMEPYYVIMRLPNGSSEEFILMTPYVRAGGRKNMVAWMAAKCDAPGYGTLVLYEFPEERNVYGPQQIAARARQDTEISRQVSLWDQRGSTVGSGNLLVIPIESSLLYVMPLYLSSTDTQIPELKRVIVVLGDAVAMEPTLEEALSKVVGATVTPASRMTTLEQVETVTQQIPTVGSTRITSPDIIRLVDQANSQYDKAQEALRRGDFAEYGRQISSLKKTLEELRSRAR
jgi:uncharacterized membrane protein (UPF0182 family)